MTISLELLSERVQATGGFQGGGITRLLGTPRMDDLTLLAREAVQNSWDARWPADSLGTVDFHVRIFTLDQAQRDALGRIFCGVPASGSNLGEVLNRGQLVVAEIRDVGTTGLNGPTRADQETAGPRNFIDFIRNIGAPQDRDESGGTYGFGKGSYYRASEASSIVVHTRYRAEDGAVDSRLIAAAVGEPFTDDGAPRTGRHFWGHRQDGDDHVEPVTGPEADSLASSVGFGVPAGSTGTSILIVGLQAGIDDSDPEGDTSRSSREAAEVIAHQLAWQCWPKMVERAGTLPMRFSVECEGSPVTVPDTTAAPSLRALSSALRAIHERGDEVEEIRSLRPRKTLGHLAFKVFSAADPTAGFGTEASAGFTVPDHHVALLRAPELVVKYLPGPPSDLGDHGWVGVFLASSDVDASFAAAEPPTHDDWVKDQVIDKRERRDVNVALREVDKAVRSRFALQQPARSAETTPVAGIATMLGDVFRMPGLDGGRPERGDSRTGGGGSGSGRRRPRSLSQVSSRFEEVSGVPAHVVTLDTDGLPVDLRVEAKASAAVDDGSPEQEPPLGSDIPRVLGWLVDGDLAEEGTSFGPVVPGSILEVAVEHRTGVVPLLVVTPSGGRT